MKGSISASNQFLGVMYEDRAIIVKKRVNPVLARSMNSKLLKFNRTNMTANVYSKNSTGLYWTYVFDELERNSYHLTASSSPSIRSKAVMEGYNTGEQGIKAQNSKQGRNIRYIFHL